MCLESNWFNRVACYCFKSLSFFFFFFFRLFGKLRLFGGIGKTRTLTVANQSGRIFIFEDFPTKCFLTVAEIERKWKVTKKKEKGYFSLSNNGTRYRGMFLSLTAAWRISRC